MPYLGVKQQIEVLLGSSPTCRRQALPTLTKLMLGEHRAVRWIFA